MKKYIIKYLFVLLAFVGVFSSCTEDFNDINKDPNAILPEEASARYFLTKAEYKLFAPTRFYYWRANLIHADRYAGYFCFGNSGSWWNDELGYTFNGGYTNAAWEMYGDYFGYINTFLKLTESGADFENPYMEAVGKILKSMYYQQYTDVFGAVPYSESGNPDITLPKFDDQKNIYEGIIADLNAAMATIGEETATGSGVDDLGSNDIIFKGDLQNWKKLANSLKLRIGMRALNAPDAGFAQTAVTEALQANLFLEDVDALLKKDNSIGQYDSGAYADVWHRFGGLGSKWKVSQTMINYLQDYNDPRLEKYADPIQGGSITLKRPDAIESPDAYEKFPKRIDFLKGVFDEAGVVYTTEEGADTINFNIPADTYYVGQPTRLNSGMKSLAKFEFFSSPDLYIIGEDADINDLAPELIMTSAEVYFLRAEAGLKGFSAGVAQDLFESGITAAMNLHGVTADDYISSADLAQLNGTTDQNLEKIAVQRWIASYTDGFEGWSIVRKSGYPTALAQGVSDTDIFGFGDIDGAYPSRMQYGGAAYDLNGANVEDALSRQGADKQNTVLWWNK